MDIEKMKTKIGDRITQYRKQSNMTQAELAQKLNYSDKAVSKWERGESVPDVMTLVLLAEEFGVSIDDLVTGGHVTVSAKMAGRPVQKRVNKGVVQMLVSLLVWFVALFAYVVLSSMNIEDTWLGFVYAIPANAIVLLSLRSAWRKYNWNMVLVSVIVWGCLLSLYLSMLIFTGYNIWKLFLLGLLGQAAVCLWFFLFRNIKEEADG